LTHRIGDVVHVGDQATAICRCRAHGGRG
jgi:hypothetical protein